jgi:hypothetical protein
MEHYRRAEGSKCLSITGVLVGGARTKRVYRATRPSDSAKLIIRRYDGFQAQCGLSSPAAADENTTGAQYKATEVKWPTERAGLAQSACKVAFWVTCPHPGRRVLKLPSGRSIWHCHLSHSGLRAHQQRQRQHVKYCESRESRPLTHRFAFQNLGYAECDHGIQKAVFPPGGNVVRPPALRLRNLLKTRLFGKSIYQSQSRG